MKYLWLVTYWSGYNMIAQITEIKSKRKQSWARLGFEPLESYPKTNEFFFGLYN